MIIENSKTYNLTEVENLFFRPTFCGKAAEEFGIRVLYNMPIPTKVPLFSHNNNILKNFSPGWQGGSSATLVQKEIPMKKLKAESAYSAEDYFSTIYEMIATSADVNLGDLTGTDLEKAETELFRRSLAESIYATTWFGDEYGEISEYTEFSGFIRRCITSHEENGSKVPISVHGDQIEIEVEQLLRETWESASKKLRALISEGNLAFFVSSDIYDAYQFYLDSVGLTNAYAESSNGRLPLNFHGIPLMEVPSNGYAILGARSFCILTDRRNLVLALNTADSPEKEVRMWYNPDEMENRQRVVFLAGTMLVDDLLIAGNIYNEGVAFPNSYDI